MSNYFTECADHENVRAIALWPPCDVVTSVNTGAPVSAKAASWRAGLTQGVQGFGRATPRGYPGGLRPTQFALNVLANLGIS